MVALEGNQYVENNPHCPAVFISWNDINGFLDYLNEVGGAELYRLRTEAEREYAARAGTTTRWSFGDDESRVGESAWYLSNAGRGTARRAPFSGIT